MTMYQDEPNTVYLTMKDSSGSAERWVVGKTLDEAIATVEAAFGMTAAAEPKKRKQRRTKAEMAQSEPTVVGKPTNGKRETVGAGWPG